MNDNDQPAMYGYEYFQKADGILSWSAGNLKFGDALAAIGYAHGIGWQRLVEYFPDIFAFEPNGRGEASTPILPYQIDFIKKFATRKPKKVLEIGGGRGEVANVLGHLGIDVVSVEYGADAELWYNKTGKKYFGENHQAVKPIVGDIKDVIHQLDLSEFDTIMMVESLEHIPKENFDPVWDKIVAEFHGWFIVTNWPDYHPIWIGRDANEHEHCRAVDDNLYNEWVSQSRACLQRHGSHLVLEF